MRSISIVYWSLMSLVDHPGFLSYKGGGFEVLHADWPAYPAGHGWELALRCLAVFPQGVRFRQLDDIDQCRLFIAVGSGPCLEPIGDLYDQKWFHVAIWTRDLIELVSGDLVSGVLSPYEAARAWYENLEPSWVEKINLPEPRPEDFKEASTELYVSTEGLVVTSKGHGCVSPLHPDPSTAHPALRERIEVLARVVDRPEGRLSQELVARSLPPRRCPSPLRSLVGYG
jgi:hypothetical protein